MNTLTNTSTGAALGTFLSEKARQWATFIICTSILATGSLCAQTPTPEMPPMKPELEARLKKLETELRCLVCQNQTLADSPAGLAGDLRREIRLLAESGKNNEEIKEHLKARYGDFVLYKPSVESRTWLLWFGPFVLLAGGALIVVVVNRRGRPAPAAPAALNEEDRQRASKLLDGE
jgi:cytochrome c-type biogenesis protein CcmH